MAGILDALMMNNGMAVNPQMIAQMPAMQQPAPNMNPAIPAIHPVQGAIQNTPVVNQPSPYSNALAGNIQAKNKQSILQQIQKDVGKDKLKKALDKISQYKDQIGKDLTPQEFQAFLVHEGVPVDLVQEATQHFLKLQAVELQRKYDAQKFANDQQRFSFNLTKDKTLLKETLLDRKTKRNIVASELKAKAIAQKIAGMREKDKLARLTQLRQKGQKGTLTPGDRIEMALLLGYKGKIDFQSPAQALSSYRTTKDSYGNTIGYDPKDPGNKVMINQDPAMVQGFKEQSLADATTWADDTSHWYTPASSEYGAYGKTKEEAIQNKANELFLKRMANFYRASGIEIPSQVKAGLQLIQEQVSGSAKDSSKRTKGLKSDTKDLSGIKKAVADALHERTINKKNKKTPAEIRALQSFGVE